MVTSDFPCYCRRELCYWEHYCLSIGNELLINQFVGVIKREFAFGGVEILSKQGSVIYPHHSINRCLGPYG